MCFQFKMKSCVNSDSVIWVGCLAVVSAFSDVASCVATLLMSLHHFTACCNWAACSLKGNVGLRIQLADTGAKFHQLSVTDYRSNCQDHGSVSEDRKSNETLEFNVNLNATMRPNYSWSKVYYRSRGNSVTIFKMKAARLEMELWCVKLDHQLFPDAHRFSPRCQRGAGWRHRCSLQWTSSWPSLAIGKRFPWN